MQTSKLIKTSLLSLLFAAGVGISALSAADQTTQQPLAQETLQQTQAQQDSGNCQQMKGCGQMKKSDCKKMKANCKDKMNKDNSCKKMSQNCGKGKSNGQCPMMKKDSSNFDGKAQSQDNQPSQDGQQTQVQPQNN